MAGAWVEYMLFGDDDLDLARLKQVTMEELAEAGWLGLIASPSGG
jgi:hypothetical protein